MKQQIYDNSKIGSRGERFYSIAGIVIISTGRQWENAANTRNFRALVPFSANSPCPPGNRN